MKEFIIKKEDLHKYRIGVDLGFRLKWWQKILIHIGFRNKWQDYSCSTVWKERKDGTLELVDLNYF
jgi:hypothetical protein